MKFKQFCGYILYNSLAKHLPRSSSHIKIGQTFFRSLCGHMILNQCGKSVNIEKGASFSYRATVGDNSGIGINAVIQGEVHIGKDCMMGPHCTIYTVNHKHSDTNTPMRLQGFETPRPVYICDDVWIGGHVTILPGVHIGKGAIIGANTVVSKDVPEYSVFCGNPGRVMKYRI